MQLFPSQPKSFELDHNMEGILEGAIKIAKKKTEELNNVDQGTVNDDYNNSDNLLKEEQAAEEKKIELRKSYLKYVYGEAESMWDAIRPSNEDEKEIEAILKDFRDFDSSWNKWKEAIKDPRDTNWGKKKNIRLLVTYYEKYHASGRQLLWDIDDSYNKVSSNISGLTGFCSKGGLGWSGSCEGGWACQWSNYNHPIWIQDKDEDDNYIYDHKYRKNM